MTAYAPIVFILKPHLLGRAAALFPFDTGAFTHQKYETFMHHKMRVEDFGLDASFENIGKIISYFYGTNRHYYDQIPKKVNTPPTSEYEATTYGEMVRFRGLNAADDRSTTIEVIFDKAIELDHNVLYTIIPHSLSQDKSMKDRIDRLGGKIKVYKDGASLTPSSQIPRLADVVRHVYLKEKFFR